MAGAAADHPGSPSPDSAGPGWARIDWDAVAPATPYPAIDSRRYAGAAMTVVEYRFAAGMTGNPLRSRPEEQLVHVFKG